MGIEGVTVERELVLGPHWLVSIKLGSCPGMSRSSKSTPSQRVSLAFSSARVGPWIRSFLSTTLKMSSSSIHMGLLLESGDRKVDESEKAEPEMESWGKSVSKSLMPKPARRGIGTLAEAEQIGSIEGGSCFTVKPASRNRSPEYKGSPMIFYLHKQ